MPMIYPPARTVTLPAPLNVSLLAWFNTLPTTLPATAGVFWNNSGTLALS